MWKCKENLYDLLDNKNVIEPSQMQNLKCSILAASVHHQSNMLLFERIRLDAVNDRKFVDNTMELKDLPHYD